MSKLPVGIPAGNTLGESSVRDRLSKKDWFWLSLYCSILFGCCLVSQRGLSIHESVLPQSAREMLADGDWLVPKRGGSPWLESPPLPQWVTATVAAPFGRCDTEGIARLAAVMMAMSTVMMVTWMASVFFGRNTGLLSGFVMATTAQFTRYAWLAEDEIFLCTLVTFAVMLFVKLEFDSEEVLPEETDSQGFLGWVKSFFGTRRFLVLALFAAIGLTNLAKGFLFGTGMAVIPMSGFLLLQFDLSKIKPYVWLWGWLAFAAIAVAWPLAVLECYPDAWHVWWADLGGRVSGDYAPSVEPIWYYPQNLLWMLAPWTPMAMVGLWLTAKKAWSEKPSAERFLWCWALLVPLVFSIPEGKNHHYLLHALAPWSMLGTLGLIRVYHWLREFPPLLRKPWVNSLIYGTPAVLLLVQFRSTLPGPAGLPIVLAVCMPMLVWVLTWSIQHPRAQVSVAGVFLIVGSGYLLGHWIAGESVDKHRHDVAFLRSVESRCAEDLPLLVDLDVQALRAFLCLFYLPEEARPLHNLSFALDQELESREVYLLTRQGKIHEMPALIRWQLVAQSPETGGETSPEDRLSLFRCTLDATTQRASTAKVRISPMQAMFREPGPVLR